MTQCTITIENARTNFAAYAPDVLGGIATGETIEETTRLMTEALEMHIELLREVGEPIPVPHTHSSLVQDAS